MTNDQIKRLCLSLLYADSETEVIQILKEAGLWDDPSLWRDYGDLENNYSQVGNQQARSDSSMVEKVINSVDANLILRCFLAGIDPESEQAPESIRAAVAMFYEKAKPPFSDSAGRISEWTNAKRLEVAQEITVAITGASPRKGNPCITIADKGEGQTPNRMPDTLLSLGKSNKLRIPFVQGKFNMGGTGALEFCGQRNLQLVMSRRHPSLPTDSGDDSAGSWGLTVVRRDDPKHGRKNSTYVYLAPIGATARKPGKGSVLRFNAKTLKLFPDGREPYVREAEWGTAIKLYEYAATGYSNTNALMKDGLMRRMDMLLPEIALPVRVHECRKGFQGHEGSFANNMTGVRTRLDDDKSNNLEMTPSYYPLTVQGESLTALAYSFKRDRADTYVKNEGVVFAVNGQAHGFVSRDFFRRRNVGMSYLADSLLVLIDCSSIAPRSREKLFMPSRDRLRAGDLKDAIEDALEDAVKHDERLRELKAKRRQEDIEGKLLDDKPLEDVLVGMLKHSPTLASLLLKGVRIPNPFKPSTGKGGKEKPFEGKRFPTFFKFRGKEIDETLERDAAINRRARIQFETDAQDDYFSRVDERGDFKVWLEVGGIRKSVSDFSGPTLNRGIAVISIQLPSNCAEGDVLKYVGVVDDKTRVNPIENQFVLTVTKAVVAGPGGNGEPKPPKNSGSGEDGAPDGLSLPKVTRVPEEDWAKHGFDRYSALKIVEDDSEGSTAYDFYINVDNLYLQTEMKQDADGAKLTKAKFIFGMVLLGMGLIHEDMKKPKTEENGEEEDGDTSLEKNVLTFTRAVAPILIPMIDELGALDADVDLGIIGN